MGLTIPIRMFKFSHHVSNNIWWLLSRKMNPEVLARIFIALKILVSFSILSKTYTAALLEPLKARKKTFSKNVLKMAITARWKYENCFILCKKKIWFILYDLNFLKIGIKIFKNNINALWNQSNEQNEPARCAKKYSNRFKGRWLKIDSSKS